MQGLGEVANDKQFVSILVDTFEYNTRENYIFKYIIDVVCDVPIRAEEYMNDTLNFIANP